jgi:uncharacterized damage-inducible protein DinB
MITAALAEFYERDLLKLKEEISAYQQEADLWAVHGEISNSAGNLCLHLIGNLNHFIGATLGQTGYVRERDLEFSQKNVPRTDLLEAIDRVIPVVKETVGKLTPGELGKIFPLEKHGQVITTEYMLLHLLTHLNYHVGQINYHRRLGKSYSSGAIVR